MIRQLVAVSNTGYLLLLTPLYPRSEEWSKVGMYSIAMVTTLDVPLAYAVEADLAVKPQVLSASWLNKKITILGEL